MNRSKGYLGGDAGFGIVINTVELLIIVKVLSKAKESIL
jgi:hypothetical protein